MITNTIVLINYYNINPLFKKATLFRRKFLTVYRGRNNGDIAFAYRTKR